MQNILIKDKDGNFKMLQNGSVTDVGVTTQNSVTPQKPTDVDVEIQEEVHKHEHVAAEQIHSEVQKHTKELAHKIVQDAGGQLDNDQKRGHLESLIITALRGVRNEFDTKQILTRPENNGGFGFSEEVAQKLWQLIAQHSELLGNNEKAAVKVMHDSVKKVQSQNMSQQQNKSNDKSGLHALRKSYQQADYDVTSLVGLKDNKDTAISQVKSNVQEGNTLVQETSSTNNPSLNKHNVQPKKEIIQHAQQGKRAVDLQKQTVHLSPPVNPVLVKETSDSTSMVDVVPPEQARSGYSAAQHEGPSTIDTRSQKRLVGPIDELQLMTLIDFRRIAENIEQRISKIIEKVDLLEEVSYIDRIKGIEAWRSSEVYSLYVEMGYDAMREDKTIEELIDERQTNKKPALNVDEFFALGKLNKNLNF